MIKGDGSEPKARQARPRAAAYAAKPRGADAPRPAFEGPNKKPYLGKTSVVSVGASGEQAEAQHSLNTKLNASYENWYAQPSPRTRASWKEYRRLEALGREEGYLCYDDPEHELYQDPEAQ